MFIEWQQARICYRSRTLAALFQISKLVGKLGDRASRARYCEKSERVVEVH